MLQTREMNSSNSVVVNLCATSSRGSVQVYGINHPRILYTWVAENHSSLICSSACNWIGVKWVHTLCWQEVGELLIWNSHRCWIQQQYDMACIYHSKNRDFRWKIPRSVYLCAQGDVGGESMCEQLRRQLIRSMNWASPATRDNHYNCRAGGWGTNPSTCIIHNWLWNEEAFTIVCTDWVRERWVYNMWCEKRWWHYSYLACIAIRESIVQTKKSKIRTCIYKVTWVVNLCATSFGDSWSRIYQAAMLWHKREPYLRSWGLRKQPIYMHYPQIDESWGSKRKRRYSIQECCITYSSAY